MTKAAIEPSVTLLRGWPRKTINRPEQLNIKIDDLEPLSGKIRVWGNNDAKYGDSFDWSAEIYWISRTEVEICAYMLPITPSIYRAIYAECAKWGIQRIKSTVYHDGADSDPVVSWIDINPTKVQQYYEREAD
jgi:hypothetical protein